MAIRIDKSGHIRKVNPPDGSYFNVNMLEKLVGGWPEPTKIGPVWVIKSEDVEPLIENYNDIASKFFQLPIYGDVLSLSALELPPEWDLIDEIDRKYTIDEIDAGFMKSINDSALSDPFSGHNPLYPDPFHSMYNDQLFGSSPKSEYFYNPNKPKNPETPQENYLMFLRDSYDYILLGAQTNFKDFVMYEDDVNIVKVPREKDRIQTINQLIKLFIEDEEFEKCAVLRDILVNQFKVEPEQESL